VAKSDAASRVEVRNINAPGYVTKVEKLRKAWSSLRKGFGTLFGMPRRNLFVGPASDSKAILSSSAAVYRPAARRNLMAAHRR
jgi:hypothetical protein